MIISTQKFVIICNGPFSSKSTIRKIAQGKKLLALDGASDQLLQMNITPDIILGDFDSIANSDAWKKHSVDIVTADNQNLTDLQKGIEYCDLHGAISIDIICAIGDRVDHTLMNLRTLRAYHRPDRPLFIHTENETIQFIKDSQCIIEGEINDPCAIMAFPKASFTSSHLKYNGQVTPLEFGFSESVSNSLTAHSAKIIIEGEALIISNHIIY